MIHERHHLWYGHPLAGGLPRATLRLHREAFQDFIRAHRGEPQIEAATKVCQDMIDHGIPDDGKPSKYRQSKYERFNVAGRIRALKDQQVTGKEVLAAAGGAWLLSYYEPRVLPDDGRLDYRMGIEVFKTRPMIYRVKLYGKGEKKDVIGGYPRKAVGQYLRRQLAVFFTRVIQGIAADQQAVVDHEALLAQEFTTAIPVTPDKGTSP